MNQDPNMPWGSTPPDPQYPESNPDNVRLNIKDQRGLWMPACIVHSDALTWNEKGLLTFIYHLDGPNNCYASNKYLGELVGSEPKTIANVVSMLRKKGFIETVSWDGRIRKLRVTDKVR